MSFSDRSVRGGKDRPGGGAPATRRSDTRPNTDVSDYNVIGNIHYRNSKKSALRPQLPSTLSRTYLTVNRLNMLNAMNVHNLQGKGREGGRGLQGGRRSL